MSSNENWDQYADYLCLNKILDAQDPASTKAGDHAHDEMLFIIFHQVYELWFKQMLYEMDIIQQRFSGDIVDDRDLSPVLDGLDRIAKIWQSLARQMDVLETMPPQSFTDFREYLKTASGFQSLQFRLLEIRLGLRRDDRLPINHKEFDEDLLSASKKRILEAEQSPSLYDQIDTWLSRTPFVEAGDYKFWHAYRDAVHKMLDDKAKLILETQTKESNQDMMDAELAAIERGKQKFDGIFDPDTHKQAVEDGVLRMSWRSLQAALFITLYREEPVLHMPFRLLNLLMDIDELITQWRYRHALMVQRMVGLNLGTGGSSGYGYLMRTLEKHRIYEDLFAMSSYLIPRRNLPELPDSIRSNMGYKYAKAA